MTIRHIAVLLLILMAATAVAGCQTDAQPSDEGQDSQVNAPVESADEDELSDSESMESGDELEDASGADASEAEDTAADDPAGVVIGRRFVVVPGDSTASYTVSEEFFGGAARIEMLPGIVEATGKTSEVSGEFTVTGDDPPVVETGEFVVDLSTLESDDSRRDKKIRENWLESAMYPQATFSATEMLEFPTGYTPGEDVDFQVAGDLTIRGITQPVVLDVTASLGADGISGTATTSVKMTDFGFEPPDIMGMLTVQDDVEVTIRFVAAEQ